MNSVQAIDLKEVSGGNCDRNILPFLFDSAGSAGYIELGNMRTAMPELLVKSPGDCSTLDIGLFIAFVRAGGEVSVQGLTEQRIRSAAALVFARINGKVEGVAALKQPQASYRRRVSLESGAPLPAAEFPFELGWVYVSPESRGKNLSLMLSQAALAESNGAGVFATSRTDNIAMHQSLAKVGLVPVGNPYVSGRGKYSLQVFVRHAAQPIIPPALRIKPRKAGEFKR